MNDITLVIVTFAVTTFFNVFMMAIISNLIIKTSNKEVTKISPRQAIQKYNEEKEIRQEQEKARVISENIDNYNGTSLGQQDIPR